MGEMSSTNSVTVSLGRKEHPGDGRNKEGGEEILEKSQGAR